MPGFGILNHLSTTIPPAIQTKLLNNGWCYSHRLSTAFRPKAGTSLEDRGRVLKKRNMGTPPACPCFFLPTLRNPVPERNSTEGRMESRGRQGLFQLVPVPEWNLHRTRAQILLASSLLKWRENCTLSYFEIGFNKILVNIWRELCFNYLCTLKKRSFFY